MYFKDPAFIFFFGDRSDERFNLCRSAKTGYWSQTVFDNLMH